MWDIGIAFQRIWIGKPLDTANYINFLEIQNIC